MNMVCSCLFSRNGSRAALVLAATTLLIATGGCAFLKPAQSETHYYLLTAANPHGQTTNRDKNEAGCVVRLLPVEVANYLQTKEMAVRAGTNEVDFSLYHCWAEPLDAGIHRVLAEDLRAAPGIRAVITDEPAPAQERVCTISVRVLACEGIETSHHASIDFKAAWQISESGLKTGKNAQGVFHSPLMIWSPGDYGQLANHLSRAVEDFSQVLTDAISANR